MSNKIEVPMMAFHVLEYALEVLSEIDNISSSDLWIDGRNLLDERETISDLILEYSHDEQMSERVEKLEKHVKSIDSLIRRYKEVRKLAVFLYVELDNVLDCVPIEELSKGQEILDVYEKLVEKMKELNKDTKEVLMSLNE